MSESTIDLVSKITELNDLSGHMQDENIDLALEYVVKLIANPEVPIHQVPRLIVKIQALAAQLQIKGKFYQTYGSGSSTEAKKTAADKKNIYYTMSAELDKLVAALKYYSK